MAEAYIGIIQAMREHELRDRHQEVGLGKHKDFALHVHCLQTHPLGISAGFPLCLFGSPLLRNCIQSYQT